MLTIDQARRLLMDRLGPKQELAIEEERTIEKEWGWVFFLNSREFVETGDPQHSLLGCCPRLVNRFDGSIQVVGHPVGGHIRQYERQLAGKACDFGKDLRVWLDYVRFDTTRFIPVCEEDASYSPDHCCRWWQTPDEDQIVLNFIALPPIHLEQPGKTTLQNLLDGPDASKEVMALDGIQCIWNVNSIWAQPPDPIYTGSLTVPFADCFYQIKIMCKEKAVTGSPEDDQGSADGLKAQFGEEARSRLRFEFEAIKLSFRADERIKTLERFELPPQSG